LATLVGPQIDVKPWGNKGEYSFATGSSQAFWSKSGRWYVGLDLIDSNGADECSTLKM
jgi:hypothetical protein